MKAVLVGPCDMCVYLGISQEALYWEVLGFSKHQHGWAMTNWRDIVKKDLQ